MLPLLSDGSCGRGLPHKLEQGRPNNGIHLRSLQLVLLQISQKLAGALLQGRLARLDLPSTPSILYDFLKVGHRPFWGLGGGPGGPPKGGGRSPPPNGMVSRAPGAVQTP